MLFYHLRTHVILLSTGSHFQSHDFLLFQSPHIFFQYTQSLIASDNIKR
uniref:Uncharacterized protein n=1 Tax=Aegilops tauschii subsp. strangulata TaxID=200361 RepID=A0A453RBR7_AEGTS